MEQQPADRVGEIASKQRQPPLRLTSKMGLAEAVPGVRNRVGQCRHGIDDLHRERSLCLKLPTDIFLNRLAKWHEVSQASLVGHMLANVCLVEPFKARVAQRGGSVVLMGVNGMINVFEAIVQLLRVSKIYRHHGCRNRITTAEDDSPDVVSLRLVVRFDVIYEDAIEGKTLGFGLGLNEIPVKVFTRIGLALALPQWQKLLVARRAGIYLLDHAAKGSPTHVQSFVLAVECVEQVVEGGNPIDRHAFTVCAASTMNLLRS